MPEQILTRIDEKLDLIVRLLGAKAIEGKSQTESIDRLGSLGLDRNVISQIVGTTPGTVSVRLSQAKRKSKSGGKKKKIREGQAK